MIKSFILFTASILSYLIKGIIALFAMIMGFLALVLVFIISCPLVLVSKIKNLIKKLYENTRRYFNCSINGSWIYC